MLVLVVYLIIYDAHSHPTKSVQEYPSMDACKEAIRKNTFRRPSGNDWTMRCSEDLDPPWERGRIYRNQDPTPLIR